MSKRTFGNVNNSDSEVFHVEKLTKALGHVPLEIVMPIRNEQLIMSNQVKKKSGGFAMSGQVKKKMKTDEIGGDQS